MMTRTTDAWRVAAALAVGPLVGGLLVGAWFGLSSLVSGGGLGLSSLEMTGAVIALTGLYATIVFAGGILVIGAPIWVVLHHKNVTGPLPAALTGILATSLGLAILTGFGATSLEPEFSLLVLAGGIVGLAIQKIAYCKVKPPPAPPA